MFICSPSSRPSASRSWLMMNSIDRLIRGQIRVEEPGVGRHLVLAIGPQDRAAEAVVGHVAIVLGAEVHRAVVVPGQPEIDPLAEVALDRRERAGPPTGRTARRADRCRGSNRPLPSPRSGRCRRRERPGSPGSSPA